MCPVTAEHFQDLSYVSPIAPESLRPRPQTKSAETRHWVSSPRRGPVTFPGGVRRVFSVVLPSHPRPATKRSPFRFHQGGTCLGRARWSSGLKHVTPTGSTDRYSSQEGPTTLSGPNPWRDLPVALSAGGRGRGRVTGVGRTPRRFLGMRVSGPTSRFEDPSPQQRDGEGFHL